MKACKSDDPGAVESSIGDYGEIGISMGAITHQHFVDALKGKKPSVTSDDLRDLKKFNEEYKAQK